MIIPARLESQRLPRKPLLELSGKPLIQYVYENAMQSEAERVWVATDSHEIEDCVRSFGGEVCMTYQDHASGTDRVAEAAEQVGLAPNNIIVNIQGDEPFLNSQDINAVATDLIVSKADTATLSAILPENRLDDPNIVKVVCTQDNMALYFSRAPIPYSVRSRDVLLCRRHLGIYAYRREYLERFRRLPVAKLEQEESLEQLRSLTHGYRISVGKSCSENCWGIDTLEDLVTAEKLLA